MSWICSACHVHIAEDGFTKAQRAKNDKTRRCKGCVEAGRESRPVPTAKELQAQAASNRSRVRAKLPLEKDARTGQMVGATTMLTTTETDGFGRAVPLMQKPTLLTHDSSGHGRPGEERLVGAITRADRLGMAAQEGDLFKVRKLLKGGVDVNYQNAASGVTSLGVAAERNHHEVR